MLSIEQHFDRVLNEIQSLRDIDTTDTGKELEEVWLLVHDMRGLWDKCAEELKKEIKQSFRDVLVSIEKQLECIRSITHNSSNNPQ